jgi:RNA polymerase sigma-70 factor (ECF subfamily)
VFQETSVVLWKKYHEFDAQKDFRVWAFGVARREALKSRRKFSRDKHVFSNDTIMRIAQAEEGFKEYLDERLALLSECMRKLKTEDGELLDKVRYPNDNIKLQAQRLGMTENVLYKHLARIRRLLMKCVEHGLRAGGGHE